MAFDGCTALQSVTLPAVKKISCCAFHSCLNLRVAEVPATAEIGKHVFDNCPNLEYLPNGYSDEKGRSISWKVHSLFESEHTDTTDLTAALTEDQDMDEIQHMNSSYSSCPPLTPLFGSKLRE